MKQYKYLYRKMLDRELIEKAYKKLRKGKTKRKEIIYIDAHLEEKIDKMYNMILNTKPQEVKVQNPELAFRPKKRKVKIIHEHGKDRKISMPDIREQWLHHIIVLVLEPIITATAYRYSCGSFPRRGAHYGKRQVERWIRKAENIRNFAKIDIRHFYDNIRIDVMMRELAIRIKDDWFLYIIRLCFGEIRKGLVLGFYLSQWLANYLLEPVDKLITESLEIKCYIRYMDDMLFFCNDKKTLHKALVSIMRLLGQRFRLKLKRNYQVCKFDYVKNSGKVIGRPIDFMGFVFFRDRTLIRKKIMVSATRLAAKLHKTKLAHRGHYLRHIQAMVSYMGWFSHTDSHDCYVEYIKPCVNIGKLKTIISKLQRRQNRNEKLAGRTLCHTA